MLAPRMHRPSPARQALFEHLLRHAAGLPNDEILAQLMSGWALGEGVMPGDLGLGAEPFAALLARHFPRLNWRPATTWDRDAQDMPERDDLIRFVSKHADPKVDGAVEMATVLASGCAGADHLWQDLGLPSRRELSQLIALNFPTLAQANNRDMKWKKFLYRELCQQEGIYVCQSPSCEVCADYAVCFGPED